MNQDFRTAQLQRLLDGEDPHAILTTVREAAFTLTTRRNGNALLRYRNCVAAIRKAAMDGATLDPTVRDDLKRVAQSHLNRVLSGGGRTRTTQRAETGAGTTPRPALGSSPSPSSATPATSTGSGR